MKRAVILFATLALAGCTGADAAKNKRPPPLVLTKIVVAKDVAVEVKAPVDLRPLAQADIGSRTLGYLDAVLVERGDAVKKGQVVAIVRPSDLPDQLSAARNGLAAAEAQSQLSEESWQRVQKLAPSGVVSELEKQQAEAQRNSTRAQADAARAQLSALATRLGETRIESPMDGVVMERRLDPGALVGSSGTGGTILTIARTDILRAYVGVNESDIAGVRVDKAAHVELDAFAGRRFDGKVARLAPAFDPVTRTLQAELRIPNPDGSLRPGMYGRGAIVTDTHLGVPVVPVESVQITNGKAFAFILDGDSVKRRALTLGVDGGDWLEIVDGVKAGEEIVVAGLEGISDGAKVRVAGREEAGKPPAKPESPKP